MNTINPKPHCCLQCGKKGFRHVTADNRRANGSIWMLTRDKHCLFCSMRCAAKYGIEHALMHDIVERLLSPEDSFCPSCGHNRDKSSVSTIAHDDGTKECQMCGAKWREAAAAIPSTAGN